MALLDNGAQINPFTPEFIGNHSLNIGSLMRPCGQMSHLHRPGEHASPTNRLCDQAGSSDGVQSHDDDQIALVIQDLSSFMAQVPMILGTPMKSHVMNVIKEMEIDTLVTPWINAQVAYLLAV